MSASLHHCKRKVIEIYSENPRVVNDFSENECVCFTENQRDVLLITNGWSER